MQGKSYELFLIKLYCLYLKYCLFAVKNLEREKAKQTIPKLMQSTPIV